MQTINYAGKPRTIILKSELVEAQAKSHGACPYAGCPYRNIHVGGLMRHFNREHVVRANRFYYVVVPGRGL